MLVDDLKAAFSSRRATPAEYAAARGQVRGVRATSHVEDSRSFKRAVEAQVAREKESAGGQLAKRLAPSLEAFIKDFLADEGRLAGRRAEAARHEVVAGKIVRQAVQLARLLKRSDPRCREAQRRGYLPKNRIYGTRRLADVGRAHEEDLGSAVGQVAADCEVWRRWTKFIARRGRGGKPIGNRFLLAEMAGLQLAREGVRLTGTRGGVYEKVVAAMYRFAGLPQSAAYRDVCKVLKDESLTAYLRR